MENLFTQKIVLREPMLSSVQITKENIKDVADWLRTPYTYCMGEESITYESKTVGIGDWIVKTTNYYGSCSFKAFENSAYKAEFGEKKEYTELKQVEEMLKTLEIDLEKRFTFS